MTASLFDEGASSSRAGAPLAVRMRPRTLDELVGQQHLLLPGRAAAPAGRVRAGRARLSRHPLGPAGHRQDHDRLPGRPRDRAALRRAVGLTAGVKDVREVIERARDSLGMQGHGTVLFIDEVHRFSKTQQDSLLPAVENGWVTLVAATTENPSFSVIIPLLSRSLVLTLSPLSDDDIRELVRRAVTEPRGLDGRSSCPRGRGPPAAHRRRRRPPGAHEPRGRGRRGLGAGERPGRPRPPPSARSTRAALRYDRDGDQHYDVISAYIKSMRGSDVDAALHYLARMLEAGEDPRFIARRLVILASEDIGWPTRPRLQTAAAAARRRSSIGLPGGRLTWPRP